MHDPQTVAHEIKYPWWKHKPWPKKYRDSGDRRWAFKRMVESGIIDRDSFWEDGYRETFITIWHVDPEKDGTDDSCGWSWPKITKKQREILRNTAWSEGHDPHFLVCKSKGWDRSVIEAEFLYRGMVLLVNRVLHLNLSLDQISKYSAEAMHIRTGGRAGDVFCFVPGYHTNFENDSEEHRRDHFHEIICGVARSLLDIKRPWWKHPKWHFWHWEFQCHPLQDFKRWAFSRCSKCGGRFKWGYAPVTNSWNGTGPRWFRSERDTFHSDCDRQSVMESQCGSCEAKN